MDDIDSSMIPVHNWDIIGFEYMIDEDESGESRVINSYINIRCNLKVLSKNILSIIDDAYSKNSLVNLVKNTYKINNVEAYGNIDTIIKDNINVEDVPVSIIYTTGRCSILNKKILEGKIVIEGVINAEIIYKNSDGEFLNVKQAFPFNTNFENENIKIDMDSVFNENLENIEAFIEAKTIGIKAVVNIRVYINSEIKKDILVDMYKTQEEIPVKDCSVIIYIVGEEDTLWGIAKKYCVSIEDICRINNLDQEDEIAGYKLLIPSKAIF
ncbi:LysM domain protein [Candidatus Arthromitus sp. SFB-4]|nr:LysM domain protein [Candidatus Arthromitus sp. SFB-4]